MGTRSTIKFYKNGICLLSLYNQYDGYIKDGYGEDLINFMKNKENHGNGLEDTCLLYLLRIKQGAYHTYATPETDKQEYNYIITEYENKIYLEIIVEVFKEVNEGYIAEYKTIFRGLLNNADVETLEGLEKLLKAEYYNN